MGWVDGRIERNYNTPMPNRLAERTAFLRSLSLFHDLSDKELHHLALESRHCQFMAGEMIMYQGDPGAACHVLVRGRVRVFVVGEDGRELAMHILGPGEIVGEMALFDDMPRSANVEALEETQTLEWRRDALLRFLQKSPTLALSLLRSMSTRLRHATGDAEGLASLPVGERLLQRLRRLADWSGVAVPDGVRIVPPMTQQELAALVGTSRESVNRALVRLRHQGKVRWDNGWIVLLNRDLEK